MSAFHLHPTRQLLSLSQTCLYLAVGCFCLWSLSPGLGQDVHQPFQITIEGGKTSVEETVLPVDPAIRIQLLTAGNMAYGLSTPDGKRLTFSQGSAQTQFLLDGQQIYPGNCRQAPLPPGPRKQPRHGTMYIWQHGNLHITQEQVVVPTRLPNKARPGDKRHMDAVLFKYVIENKGQQPVKVGMMVRIDMYNWTTDGPVFAAPTTLPGKIIDGMALVDKQVPDYLQSLQHPNLQNPGHLAYFTFNLGRKWEKPSKVIATRHGSPMNGWDVQPQPSTGDSDIIIFWETKSLAAGKKREILYAYGTGIASSPENEGRVTIELGGSFEPNKLCTITALVDDPLEGQSLQLRLPPGMERLQGPAIQPVPAPTEDNRSIVQWQARVRQPGRHPIEIKSSHGVTTSKIVTVTSRQ